ncbi:MAG: DinB family protein [Acidobacteriaceae bacterium]
MTTSIDTLNPYARFLGAQDPLAVLPATPSRLKDLARSIGPARITQPPAPGKWSARDILCHLADCEIAFAFRLRQTLAEDHHVLQPFDQEKWAPPYSGIEANEALATFSLLRRWNLLLIESALPKNAGKPVTHPERGAMTFATIVETMAGHDLNHLGQLERIAASSAS